MVYPDCVQTRPDSHIADVSALSIYATVYGTVYVVTISIRYGICYSIQYNIQYTLMVYAHSIRFYRLGRYIL